MFTDSDFVSRYHRSFRRPNSYPKRPRSILGFLSFGNSRPSIENILHDADALFALKIIAEVTRGRNAKNVTLACALNPALRFTTQYKIIKLKNLKGAIYYCYIVYVMK